MKKLNETSMIGIGLILLGLILIGLKTDVRVSLYTFRFGGASISSGILAIPLFASIIMIVAMDNNIPGLILLSASLGAILVALILSVSFYVQRTTMLGFIICFAPLLIGAGLLIKGLLEANKKS